MKLAETLKTNEYPQAIADLQREVHQIEQRLRSLRESVAFCLNAIDRQVAFDQALKNDNQRKARRAELMESDQDYIEACLKLKNAEDIRTELDIDLQLLRNQFSLLKLERREAIAAMELHASTAA